MDKICDRGIGILNIPLCSGHKNIGTTGIERYTASTVNKFQPAALEPVPRQKPATVNTSKKDASKKDKYEAIEGIAYFIFALIIYLIPAFIADSRKHNNSNPIALANLFFGWTVIGWLACLIWAFSSNTKTHDLQIKAPIVKEPQADTKKCPYCAEEIKKEAVLCRFCGKEVENKA